MKEARILGVGIHEFGRFPQKHYVDIACDAIDMALKDAGIEWKQIQSVYCSKMYLPQGTATRIVAAMGRTGIPAYDVEAACAGGGYSLSQACAAVASGMFDIVLAIGIEKMQRGFISPAAIYEDWQIHMGLSQAPCLWAIEAKRHMHDYGTTVEQMAKVSIKNHKQGVLNPYAMYRKELTMEQILTSPLVCDPLRLLMICAPNEGAAAAIVCSEKVAKKLRPDAVRVAAAVQTTDPYPATLPPAFYFSARPQHPSGTTLAAQKAFNMASIGPEDLDLVELQDVSASCEILFSEELGLCKPGEGGRLVDEGVTALGGRMPINVSGGLQSKGEPLGASHLGQIVELVWQVRGQAGQRQVAGAKVGLAHARGAGSQTAVTIIKA